VQPAFAIGNRILPAHNYLFDRNSEITQESDRQDGKTARRQGRG
jgi:hypothetical protein